MVWTARIFYGPLNAAWDRLTDAAVPQPGYAVYSAAAAIGASLLGPRPGHAEAAPAQAGYSGGPYSGGSGALAGLQRRMVYRNSVASLLSSYTLRPDLREAAQAGGIPCFATSSQASSIRSLSGSSTRR